MQQNTPISKAKIKWQLFLLGIFKIPMIGYVRPRLISIDNQKAVLRIKLRRGTRNHLKSMYFGALSVGADVAAGIHAFYYSEMLKVKISFSFKSMNALFLKRAETNIIFISQQGDEILRLIEQSELSKSRVEQIILVEAFNKQDEKVAIFEMMISLKAL